jgi:hypothetical protein
MSRLLIFGKQYVRISATSVVAQLRRSTLLNLINKDNATRVSTQSGTKTPKMALKDPHPPAPSPKAGEGEPERKAKSLAPSPLVGEGWGEGEPMCPG